MKKKKKKKRRRRPVLMDNCSSSKQVLEACTADPTHEKERVTSYFNIVDDSVLMESSCSSSKTQAEDETVSNSSNADDDIMNRIGALPLNKEARAKCRMELLKPLQWKLVMWSCGIPVNRDANVEDMVMKVMEWRSRRGDFEMLADESEDDGVSLGNHEVPELWDAMEEVPEASLKWGFLKTDLQVECLIRGIAYEGVDSKEQLISKLLEHKQSLNSFQILADQSQWSEYINDGDADRPVSDDINSNSTDVAAMGSSIARAKYRMEILTASQLRMVMNSCGLLIEDQGSDANVSDMVMKVMAWRSKRGDFHIYAGEKDDEVLGSALPEDMEGFRKKDLQVECLLRGIAYKRRDSKVHLISKLMEHVRQAQLSLNCRDSFELLREKSHSCLYINEAGENDDEDLFLDVDYEVPALPDDMEGMTEASLKLGFLKTDLQVECLLRGIAYKGRDSKVQLIWKLMEHKQALYLNCRNSFQLLREQSHSHINDADADADAISEEAASADTHRNGDTSSLSRKEVRAKYRMITLMDSQWETLMNSCGIPVDGDANFNDKMLKVMEWRRKRGDFDGDDELDEGLPREDVDEVPELSDIIDMEGRVTEARLQELGILKTDLQVECLLRGIAYEGQDSKAQLISKLSLLCL